MSAFVGSFSKALRNVDFDFLLALPFRKGSLESGGFGAAQKGADAAFGRHNLTTTSTRAPPHLDLPLLPHLHPKQGCGPGLGLPIDCALFFLLDFFEGPTRRRKQKAAF